MIKIYDRKNKKLVEEEQYGSKKLDILYNKPYGRFFLKLVINPLFSSLYGIYNNTKLSKKKIIKLITTYKIDMSKYEDKNYNSFNSFFTRKLKLKKISTNKNYLVSPAESKLLIYKIDKELKVNIKNSIYTIEELIGESIDKDFSNGYCLIFRLSMDNYHRYCFIDDGKLLKSKKIKGKLHTVSSISKNYKIYKENKRVVSQLKTKNLGKIYYIEVGALLVGKIINHKKEEFFKGEEKGYFDTGGSTIVILTKNNIKLDKDIIEYSEKGIETKVDYGEKIGVII